MKKLFIIALAGVSLSMFSCKSGDAKEEEKKDGAQVEQAEAATVESQAEELATKMFNAQAAMDMEAMEKIQAEGDAWFDALSEEDQKIAAEVVQATFEKLAAAPEAEEAEDAEEDEEL